MRAPRNTGQAYIDVVNKVILEFASQDLPVTRKDVTAEACRRHNDYSSSPGSYYRQMGLVLHFIRTRVHHEPFDHWIKTNKLTGYLSQIQPDQHADYWIVWKSRLDPELAKFYFPYTNLMNHWNLAVAERTGKTGPFNVRSFQFVRAAINSLEAAIRALKHIPGWNKLGFSLPTAKPAVMPRVGFPTKEPVTAFDCIPITWTGSKRRSVKRILELLPDNGELIDVFGGSGAIALMVRANRPSVQVHYNDRFRPLCEFYKAVRDDVDYLIDKLYKDRPDPERWAEYRSRLNSATGPELGWLLFYVVTYSFQQHANTFGPNNHCSVRSQVRKFCTANRLLQGVTITNHDFREIIPDAKGVYLDPPYFEEEGLAHYHPFDTTDHDDLCNLLMGRNKPWLLSYNNHPEVHNRYWWAKVEENVIHRSSGGSNRRTVELLIRGK